jgi:uncharacterized protein
MSITASALRELHRIHRQLTDLRGQLARGPRQLHAAETALERLEAASVAAKAAWTKTRVLADEKQLQLRQREDRIQDLQGKLNTCGSNREYQAIREQMAADQQANSVLADEILEALERSDTQQAEWSRVQAERDRAAEILVALRARTQQDQTRLEAELERVTGELEEAEKALPADFKADYQRISRVRGENTLAQVDSGTCSSCYQLISTQTINDLMLSKPVFCKSCGALLYLPEDGSYTQ